MTQRLEGHPRHHSSWNKPKKMTLIIFSERDGLETSFAIPSGWLIFHSSEVSVPTLFHIFGEWPHRLDLEWRLYPVVQYSDPLWVLSQLFGFLLLFFPDSRGTRILFRITESSSSGWSILLLLPPPSEYYMYLPLTDNGLERLSPFSLILLRYHDPPVESGSPGITHAWSIRAHLHLSIITWKCSSDCVNVG